MLICLNKSYFKPVSWLDCVSIYSSKAIFHIYSFKAILISGTIPFLKRVIMHSQHAFTLIEASLTLFIIGILITLSLPMLKSFIERTDDELMQSQLLRAIALARLETGIRHMPVTLCKSKDRKHCTGDWKDGWIVFVDPNEEGVVYRTDQILTVMQTTARYGKLYWRSFPVYRDYLLFLPNRVMSSNNGTFWYCRYSTLAPAWAIVMNKFGRVRTVYPDSHGEIRDNQGKFLRCIE